MKKRRFNKKVGSFLKKKRNSLGLSGEKLSKSMNISQQQISRYENGASSLTVYQLDTYLKVLNLSWLDFFFSVIENGKTDWENIFNNEMNK